MNNVKVMNRAADNIRILAAAMVEKAKSGHPGGAMGGADFINVLYSEFLVYDPGNPEWAGRDRFFLDPGHMSPMLYSVLALAGKFSLDDLKQFRQWGSITPGHPERDLLHGVENTSGPLGQGHTYAVGAAIAARFLQAKTGRSSDQKIYAFISDGGVQEEIGRVQDLLVDDQSGRVEGLVIARHGIWQKILYVKMEHIQSIGKAGIRIPDKKYLQHLPKNKLALSQNGWLGRKIFDAQGHDAGTVADVLVKNGMISGWEISTGLWGDLHQGRDFLPWPSLQNSSQGFISMI